MLPIFVAVIGLSSLIIIHEAGHYWMARAFGIRITRFSIGFGPVLFKYQARGSCTVFQICALPFLAYVMYADAAEARDRNDRDLYANKSALARASTVAAGPLANYLAASLLIFALALCGWQRHVPSDPLTIEAVEAASPAAHAGLRAGDVILQVDGVSVRQVDELTKVIGPRPGQATGLVVERGGRRLAALVVTPRTRDGRGVIGIVAHTELEYRALSVREAARLAASVPWQLTIDNLRGIAAVLRSGSSAGFAGPIGIGKLVAHEAEQGAYALIWSLVLISVGLGCFNLLPLPALDGGKLMFLAYELITRRKPNASIEATVHAAGLLILLGVIALATVRDLVG